MAKRRGKGAYMISAVAEMYEVHPQTLRLYERQGLLRDNAFFPLIAFRDRSTVKHLEKLHLLLLSMSKVQTAAVNCQSQCIVDVRATERQIQFSGHVQDAITDQFCFHPS